MLVLKGEDLSRRIPFLSFLASQVALAVRNAQAYLKAEELAINEERTRIAREIHDGLAQSLAFMALKLDLVERLWEKDKEAALGALAEVRETLRAQIREVRRSIFALRPIDLERYGFLESLRRYAQAFAEQAGFRVQLSLPERVGLSQASELVLFRVLQEALTNAAKHARPTRVEVVLEPLGSGGEARGAGQRPGLRRPRGPGPGRVRPHPDARKGGGPGRKVLGGLGAGAGDGGGGGGALLNLPPRRRPGKGLSAANGIMGAWTGPCASSSSAWETSAVAPWPRASSASS